MSFMFVMGCDCQLIIKENDDDDDDVRPNTNKINVLLTDADLVPSQVLAPSPLIDNIRAMMVLWR